MRDERAREAAAGDAELPPGRTTRSRWRAPPSCWTAWRRWARTTPCCAARRRQAKRLPGKPRVYLENTRYVAGFLGFASDFAPDQLSDSALRETREFPEGNSRETEWSTKHPLVSLETSGNAKCWGPSGFPLGCRKPSDRPSRRPIVVHCDCGPCQSTDCQQHT